MKKTNELNVKGTAVRVVKIGGEDFVCLTDIAATRNPTDPRFVVQSWMRNRMTVLFLGLWEELNNPEFNRVGFEAVKEHAEDGIPQPQRLKRLNEIAIHQMKILSAGSDGRNLLK